MIAACHLLQDQMQRWFDDVPQPPDQIDVLEAHIAFCPACQERIMAWRRVGQELRSALAPLGRDSEPLLGLQNVRSKMREESDAAWFAKPRFWVADMWRFERRRTGAVLGLTAFAAVLALVTWSAWEYGPAEHASKAQDVRLYMNDLGP